MLAQDDERDEDRDEDEEDADDSENNDSDDQEEDESGDDNEDEDSDDSDDDEDSDEDDDKPVTRKELREMLRKNGNRQNANRRVHSKNRNDRNDRDRGNRPNSQSPKTEERLSSVEKAIRKGEILEKKRTFGFENNLSPAQVDMVFRMTKRPTKKFLEEAPVKAALDAIAAQSNVRNNTPSGSGRGSFKSSGGKSWDKLDDKEKQDNFADRRRAILANKRG